MDFFQWHAEIVKDLETDFDMSDRTVRVSYNGEYVSVRINNWCQGTTKRFEFIVTPQPLAGSPAVFAAHVCRKYREWSKR